jgi:hypothetical protein
MRRLTALALGALIVLAAAEFLFPSAAVFAKGGYTRPPIPQVVTAGAPLPSRIQAPTAILGGCGPKRVRDHVTGRCRGPADIGD